MRIDVSRGVKNHPLLALVGDWREVVEEKIRRL